MITMILVIGISWYIFPKIYEGFVVNGVSDTPLEGDSADQTVTSMDKIPDGYYNTEETKMADGSTQYKIAKIPYGYIADSQKKLIRNTNVAGYAADAKAGASASVDTSPESKDLQEKTKYNALNALDTSVQYHADPADIKGSASEEIAKTGMWVLKDGKKVLVPWSEINKDVTYYQPGSYPYSTSNYVPNYEDSVYLSRTTGQTYMGRAYDTASMKGGFCTQYKNDPAKLEEICKTMDANKCGSTSCCVLLGGSKCVSGDEKGPTMKVNYSDIFVQNKDVYYYQGKCYGNCQ